MYLLLALEDGQGLRGILTFVSGYAMLCYAWESKCFDRLVECVHLGQGV